MNKGFCRRKQILKWLKRNRLKSHSKYTVKDKFLFKKILFTKVKKCYAVCEE